MSFIPGLPSPVMKILWVLLKTLNLTALQGPNCLHRGIFSKESEPRIDVSCLQQLTDESFTEYQSFSPS